MAFVSSVRRVFFVVVSLWFRGIRVLSALPPVGTDANQSEALPGLGWEDVQLGHGPAGQGAVGGAELGQGVLVDDEVAHVGVDAGRFDHIFPRPANVVHEPLALRPV